MASGIVYRLALCVFYTLHKIIQHHLAEYLDVVLDDSAKTKVQGLAAMNDAAVLAAVTE